MALKFKKSGGGFLNGVNGKVVEYQWEDKTWGEGEAAYRTLTLRLLIDYDGADEPVKQFLGAGFLYDGMSISDDGKTIEVDGDEDSPVIGDGTEAARFLTTLVENGFPEADLPANLRNLEAILNWRVTFGKELNKERQMVAGKKKLGKKATGATEEEIMLAGRRQDPNDKKKFYNHDRLIVTAVLGQDEAAKPAKGAKAGKSTASTAGKATSGAAKNGKTNGAAKSKDNDESELEAADAILVDILADAKDNTIPKASLSSAVVKWALANDKDNSERDALRKLFGDTEFLGRQNGWTFAADSKKQEVALA